MVRNAFIEKTYDVGTHWNCLIEVIPMCTYNRGNSNVYLQHMLLKIRKKTIWKIKVSCPLSLPLLNIQTNNQY